MLFLGFFGLILGEYASFNDKKMHVIFCSVGQGDAIIIKTPNGHILLQDGGPDNTVLSCLSRHIPFWQRQISSLILTHPHADHLNGLIDVLDNYEVPLFITEPLVNKTAGYDELIRLLTQYRVSKRLVTQGATFSIDDVSFTIDEPTREFLALASPTGTITDSSELASLLVTIRYGNFSVLLTGDSQTKALEDAILSGYLHRTTILQIPHHGSATGITLETLEAIHPVMAVISVGKQNKYHLPHQKVLGFLTTTHTPFKRTDLHGDVEFISDGRTWDVR